MGKFIDLSGQQFGNWKVILYDKNTGKWLCECQCENHTHQLIASADLRKGKSTNCGCMRKKDLTGKEFKHLIVDSYAGDYHWNCHCKECGKEFKVHTYHLEHGNIPKCTHGGLDDRIIDITGQQFGQWKVLSYAGNKYWNCECQCPLHTKRKVLGKSLRSGESKSCGLDKPGAVALMNSDSTFIDMTGQRFGDWLVLEYQGKGMWKCQCQCENKTIRNVSGSLLRAGKTKSCGHDSGVLKDIKNQTFGELTAIEHMGKGIWKCQCSCGNIVEVSGHLLRSGHTKSCGSNIHRREDLTNKRFYSFTAIEYVGEGKWKCRCECGNIRIHSKTDLYAGRAKSCGCKRYEYRDDSMVQLGIFNNRTDEQKEAIKSKENIIKFIGNRELSIQELAKELGINKHYTSVICTKYGLYDKYIKRYSGKSSLENEVFDYIQSIYNREIIRNDRKTLNGKELDIYIPDKKLAIEFNGTYWHSDEQKPINYHQQKTIECIQKGIRLIHIFEYEWLDKIKQNKLKEYLKTIICEENLRKFYARNLTIKLVDTKEKENFEINYHLQASASSNIALGLYNGDELLGLMTFGKPRFNNNFQFELIRLCYKHNTIIVGGTERLFKHFIDTYKPESIVSYCDISKFDGNVYLKLGFKTSQDNLTHPNYVWISPDRNEVLPRYRTQKQKLIDLGYGEFGNTEDEIMRNLDYIKVYDCGSLRFEWYKNK